MGAHSPDRRWWWDGVAWRPAFSPDGRYWFDGSAWRSTATTPWWVWGGVGTWLGALMYAELMASAVTDAPQPAQAGVVWALALSPLLPVLASVVLAGVGFVCGARRRSLARVFCISVTVWSALLLVTVVPKPP